MRASAWVHVSRLYATTAGAAAFRAAVPLACGIGLAAAVTMGPTGLHPADVARAMGGSTLVRSGVWGAWTALSFPPARALFATREAWILRSLPLSLAEHALLVGAALLLLSLPWAAFWAVAGGAVIALAAVGAAAGLLLAAIARPRRPLEVAAATGLVGAIVADVPAAALLGVALVVTPPLFKAAFARAPERDGARPAARRASGAARRSRGPAAAALALTRAHLTALVREAGVALLRGVAFACTGAAIVALAARNAARPVDDEGAAALTLGITAVPLALGAATAVGPTLSSERRFSWLLDATATAPTVRAAARIASPSLVGVALGAIAAVVVALIGGLASRSLAVPAIALVPWGGAIGLGVVATARWADRPTGVDGGAILMSALAVGAAAALFGATFGLGALVLAAAFAPALAVLDARRAAAVKPS